MSWDLWVDYHRRDGDGLTHASLKDQTDGVSIAVGQLISVGNEEADPALAEVVSIDERGIVLVKSASGPAYGMSRHETRSAYAAVTYCASPVGHRASC